MVQVENIKSVLGNRLLKKLRKIRKCARCCNKKKLVVSCIVANTIEGMYQKDLKEKSGFGSGAVS